MAELCLMASCGGAPDLRIVLPSEQGFNSALKFQDNHFLPCHDSNQDFVSSFSLNSNSLPKEDWKSAGGLFDCNNFFKTEPTFKRPALMNVQGTHPEWELSSLGIAAQCIHRETILKSLATGPMGISGCLHSLSMIDDLVWPQTPMTVPFTCDSRWGFNDADPQQSLIYPSTGLYFNEPLAELEGDYCSCAENTSHLDGRLQYNCSKTDIFSVISAINLSEKRYKPHKQTMLVPYFERRKRANASTKLATEKVGSLKSHDKVKEKTSQRNKIISARIGKERDKSYLQVCEVLLSIVVDKKKQSKNAIYLLKKSSPQLPQLLTQFSASIAGVGIAVAISVVCTAAFNGVPFCASWLLSSTLGLVLISLSWSVHRLRDTVVSISKTSGKIGEKEDEMMIHLQRNMKDIYLRLAALMAVTMLRLM